MIFAVDVGNTNIVLGAYKNDKLLFTARLLTKSSKTEDEYAIDIINILKIYNMAVINYEGAIISSVVPSLIPILKKAILKSLKIDTLVVNTKLNLGMNIKTENPGALGADLICGSVAALQKYDMPCIIFDLGTATTICAIDKNKNYLGGSIFPGVNISLRALSNTTAQLPHINLYEECKDVIGKNTISAMLSGVILGTASLIDGMIERYKSQIGEDAVVIATGGIASLIVPNCKSKINLDEQLVLDGLNYIYNMNTPIHI